MQIFRDDTRRRWRRLQVAFVVGLLALVAVSIVFVKTLRPRPAAVLAPAPVTAAIDLDAVRTEAVQAARTNPRKAVEVPAGIAAIAPASTLVGSDKPSDKTSKALRIGFVDATEEEAIHSITAHGDELTHVAIEGLHVRDGEGGVLGQIPDDALAAAKKHGLKVLEVLDDVRDDLPRPLDVSALGKDRQLARRFATLLEAKLRADGAAGVVLALGEDEGDLDGTLRGVVVEEVYARLKPCASMVALRRTRWSSRRRSPSSSSCAPSTASIPSRRRCRSRRARGWRAPSTRR